MIHIMLNNAKKKILKNIVFSILNRSYKYTFLSNREHWHAYTVDIIDTKGLKIKATKDWETINKNVESLIPRIKVLIKFIYLVFFFVKMQFRYYLSLCRSDGKIPVPYVKLTKDTGNKVLNFRDAVLAISVKTDDEVSSLNNIFSCDCKNSYYGPQYKHVATDDLRFISSYEIQKYFQKVLIIVKKKQLIIINTKILWKLRSYIYIYVALL